MLTGNCISDEKAILLKQSEGKKVSSHLMHKLHKAGFMPIKGILKNALNESVLLVLAGKLTKTEAKEALFKFINERGLL